MAEAAHKRTPSPVKTTLPTVEVGSSTAGLAALPGRFPNQLKMEPSILEELAFQQHMMQLKQQHQYIQHQFLEEQYQKNRLLLKIQQDSQYPSFHHQTDILKKEETEQIRIESLRQKDEISQSAVASPEVKRRLQEVILERKRKEAAASMGNLKLGIPVSTSQPVQTAILRKVQSESNLLKIKSRRGSDRSSGPYSRAFNHQLRLVPEATVVSGSEGSTPSPLSSSGHAPHPLQVRPAPSSPDSSSPSSPQGHLCRPSPLSLASSSRSLPNIPSSLETARRSPPIRAPGAHRPNQRHLGRSHSSAILPLRKHLIEKSLAEKKSVDDNQYYYQQNKIEKERLAKSVLISRPLEEVMEEEVASDTHPRHPYGGPTRITEEMEELDPAKTSSPLYLKKSYFKGFVGPAGISPLVLGDGVRGVSYLQARSLDLRTGLAFNSAMLQHQCICEETSIHPENPERLQYVLARLGDAGILNECEQVSQRATLEQIQSCHSEAHTLMFGTDVLNRKSIVGQDLEKDGTLSKFTLLPCGGLGVDSDTYWNEIHTSTAARFAVGSAVELGLKISRGELKNGFAIVRPPGHHAEAEEAMGFCYFNTVAITAKQILQFTAVHRVLIVDWAIHHGNGTQKMFYDDPRVLYVSIHRHDNGNFYPGTGSSVECGTGQGLGNNVNIAWSGGLDPPMGDAEYLAAFRSILMPIARSFDPDFVLVSAGFDAAVGHEHPIGGYRVSTACFAFLTHQLQSLAGGRVELILEGGYNIDVLCDSVEQCCRSLLGQTIQKIVQEELGRRPCQNAVDTLQKTLAIQSQYWPVLSRYSESCMLSHLETWEKEREESEALSAMASLSMQHQLN